MNLTIVIVNNDGGGIFSFLPQANEPKYFESLFGTSTELDFRFAAAFMMRIIMRRNRLTS